MNTLKLRYFAVLFILSACHTESKNDNNKVSADTVKAVEQINGKDLAVQDPVKKKQYAHTLKIDYNSNQEILDILPLIPDSSMASWKWSKAERLQFLNSVKATNSFIDTTENYNTISKISAHYFATQVVDGLWVMASYKIKNGNYIIITNDVVGDGKNLQTYELMDGRLTSLKPATVFGQDADYFLALPEDEKCKEFYEDVAPFISYDLITPNTIHMYAGNFDQADSKQCLKGNAATLIFNQHTKKFDLKKVEWLKAKN